MAENILTIIGRAFTPKKFRPDLRLYVLKAGYDDVPYTFFCVFFFLADGITYFLYLFFFYPALKDYSLLQSTLLTFVIWAGLMFILVFTLAGMLYFYWNIKIYNRTKELEVLLPEYLTLVSTNLKGGMSFENALWGAI